MNKVIIAAASAALSTLVPAIAIAADPEEVAAARIGYFKLVNLEMGGLSAMAQGKTPYDADRASAHAADLKALAEYLHDDLLVEQTSNADLPGKTRALPAIWSDMEGYQAKGLAFYEAVIALNEVAGQGQGAFAPAFGKVGGTCKACHDDYRAKDF